MQYVGQIRKVLLLGTALHLEFRKLESLHWFDKGLKKIAFPENLDSKLRYKKHHSTLSHVIYLLIKALLFIP